MVILQRHTEVCIAGLYRVCMCPFLGGGSGQKAGIQEDLRRPGTTRLLSGSE